MFQGFPQCKDSACLLARAVYLCIFYSRRMITFHCLIYFQLSYFFLVVLIIPQILWNNRFLINADQMSYSTLYWVGQKVCLSFSLWCLVGEQQVFAEYILIKNNISEEVENRTLILICGTQLNKHSSLYVIIVMFGELYIVYSCMFIVFKKHVLQNSFRYY